MSKHAEKRSARRRFLREQMPKKNTMGNSRPFEKVAEPPVFEHELCAEIVSDAVAGLVPLSVTLDGENPQFELAGSDEHVNAIA